MSRAPDHNLPQIAYMQFPFRIDEQGAKTSTRIEHIRQQIEQVIYTIPEERVFREKFGAGAKRLVFEPNTKVLANYIKDQLKTSLQPILAGEIDPLSLQIVTSSEEQNQAVLLVEISYLLTTVGYRDRFTLKVRA